MANLENSTDRTRQWGETIEQIRPDHVKRYLFAARRVRGLRVLDLACGCGYGSWLMHGAGGLVTSVDISEDAINYAKKYYQGPDYKCQKAEETGGEWDVLVSFETLEHLTDPSCVLRIKAPKIICSVPNENVLPFVASHFKHDQYPHQRHYTPQEFEDLLQSAGYMVTEKYSQHDKYTGKILPDTEGRFLVYVGVKDISSLPA